MDSISRSDIIQLIEKRETDSYKTHLQSIFKFDFRSAGEVGNRTIKIWRQNFWNRLFYPIFQFDLNKEGHLINISDRINPIGRIFFIVFCVVICIPWFYWIFDDFDLLGHWIQILTGILFLGIFILIGLKVYKMEKEMQLDQIYELLDLEIEYSKTEKEWGWKKVLVRSILYLLSFFLIAVSIFIVLPRGHFFVAIGTLTIVGFYLCSDLKIILKKKKKPK